VPTVQTYLTICLPPNIPTPIINLCSTSKDSTSCQLTVGATPPSAGDADTICKCLVTGLAPQIGATTPWKCHLGLGSATTKRQSGSNYVAVIQSADAARLAAVSAFVAVLAVLALLFNQ